MVAFVATIIGSVIGFAVFKGNQNFIVNSSLFSSAKIQVLTTYFIGNTYRVYATVIEDSNDGSCTLDGICPNEIFEISNSFIEEDYRSADLLGKLRSYER